MQKNTDKPLFSRVKPCKALLTRVYTGIGSSMLATNWVKNHRSYPSKLVQNAVTKRGKVSMVLSQNRCKHDPDLSCESIELS